MNELIHYDAAKLALAEAVKFDDVLEIKDRAKHAELYARQARDTELIERATEIKVRAERRAGQMLVEAKASGDLRGRGNPKLSQWSHASTIGLDAIGITKNESSRWQKLAAADDERFEKAIEAAKEVAREVTTSAILKAVREDRPDATLKTKPPKTEPKQAEPDDKAQGYGEIDKLGEAISVLTEENESLSLQISAMLFDGDDEEKAIHLDRLTELTTENKSLTRRLDAMTRSCDDWMRKAGSLIKDNTRLSSALKKLHKEAKNG